MVLKLLQDLLTFSACLDAYDLLQHKDFLLTKFELNNENFSSGVKKFGTYI